MKNFLNILCFVMLVLLFTNKSYAITPDEASSSSYVNEHGHSQEAARIVDLQKKQINGQNTKKKHYFGYKYVNYLKKQLVEPDLTKSFDDFGENNIKF